VPVLPQKACRYCGSANASVSIAMKRRPT
jgi:hypothetical protein